LLDPKCYPKCNLKNMAAIGNRPNPSYPHSSDYGILGCKVCGTLWEFRPEYEVEDRFGGGPQREFEVSEEYVIKHYPNLNDEKFKLVLAARKAASK
jgi:hypothetical protein